MLNYRTLGSPWYRLLFTICCLSFFSFKVYANAGGIVYSLQMPAWLERGEIKMPLKPGMEINSGDTIITGAYARVLIHLDEGSLFKVAENAKIIFNKLQPAEEADGFFEGNIHIKQGAFRFTTTPLGDIHSRNLTIIIGHITSTIRGTDIWGRSLGGTDNLVLIEGRIKTQRNGEPEFDMQQSLSWYKIDKEQPGEFTQTIPQEKLARWAAETELLSGGGVISVTGRWAVNLISLRDEKVLNKIRLKLAHKGYTNSVKTITIKGKKWYRLHVSGFENKADAQMFSQSAEVSLGFKKPWIVRF